MKTTTICAPYPYMFFDALMESTIREILPRTKLRARVIRTTLSAGSCVYSVQSQKHLVDMFTLRTTIDNQTAITVYSIDSELEEQLLTFLAGFKTVAMTTIANDKLNLSIDDLAQPKEMTALLEILKEYYQTILGITDKKPEKPSRGAPLDSWLDWRDAERKRGTRWTLAQIAEQSGWSESTVRKQSALRKTPKK